MGVSRDQGLDADAGNLVAVLEEAMENHLAAVFLGAGPLEVDYGRVVSMDLAEGFGFVVEDGDNEDKAIRVVGGNFGQHLDDALGVGPPLDAGRTFLVVKAVEPFLEFVKEKRSGPGAEHFLHDGFAGECLAGLLELAEEAGAFGMATENEIPKEAEFAVMDRLGDREKAARKPEVAQIDSGVARGPVCAPGLDLVGQRKMRSCRTEGMGVE
ncbi:hypothetical protein SBV1_2740017 [Verrucomicrobia bacterium]|nr:hypothetical protein SBV1_2740017 [Verrucomicrobiota bacterium]